MNPVWLTVLVAAISLVSALSSQWVGGYNQRKLATVDRAFKRDERQLQAREEACRSFLATARAFQSAARSRTAREGLEDQLTALREAAAHIELNAPELADGPLAAVLTAAERWHDLLVSNPATAPVIKEADDDFQQALTKLRDLMREQLGTKPRQDSARAVEPPK